MNIIRKLTKTASLTFRFKKAEDIIFTNWSNNVTDDRAVLVLSLAEDFDADLGDTSTGSSTTETLDDTSVFNFFLLLWKGH